MHVVIGVITALGGLIWAFVALQRSGFNIDSINPFLWFRRNQWKKLYSEKPIYTLDKPVDVAALLLLGVAKCEGEISTEQKRQITSIFENEFHLSADEAADLLLACAYLMRDEIYLVDNLPKILRKSAEKFSREQIQSSVKLMHDVAALDGPINNEQQKLIQAFQEYWGSSKRHPGKWE